jgi:hypothetical protein
MDQLEHLDSGGEFQDRLAFVLGNWEVEEHDSLFFGNEAKSNCYRSGARKGTSKNEVKMQGSAILLDISIDGSPGTALSRSEQMEMMLVTKGVPGHSEQVTGVLTLREGGPIVVSGLFRTSSLVFESYDKTLVRTLGKEFYERIAKETGNEPEKLESDGSTLTTIVCRPLTENKWMLGIYRPIRLVDGVVLQKAELIHRRIAPLEAKVKAPELREVVLPPSSSINVVPKMLSLEARIEECKSQLEEARQSLEMKGDLEEAEDDLGDCEDEILDRELKQLGLNGLSLENHEREASLAHLEQELQEHYRQYLDLESDISDSRQEIESLEGDIEDLEDEIEDLEDGVDDDYQDWEEASLQVAEQIIERSKLQGEVPLLTPESFAYWHPAIPQLSKDAQKQLWTLKQLMTSFQHDAGLSSDDADKSPIIAEMSKCCERIFSDFFSARHSCLLSDPGIVALYKAKKREIEIPPSDQSYGINRNAIARVLVMVWESSQPNWSGPRKCGIALLLFGRRNQVKKPTLTLIDNPLGCHGSEDELNDLRLALYKFQNVRNGFVHHDSASWEDVERIRPLFERCLFGLLTTFYGQ